MTAGDWTFLLVGVAWGAAAVFAVRWALVDMARARIGEGVE